MQAAPEKTASGMYITYRTSIATDFPSFHLGGVRADGSDWSWKVSPGNNAMPYPDGRGTFPDYDAYGGHDGIAALVSGHSVIQGYDGQYGNFSSQWMHWWDDGLFVGQFGAIVANYVNSDMAAPAGFAGNIAQMASTTVNGNVYLYTSDEGAHEGLHRWKISNLGSVHEISGKGSLGSVVSLSTTLF